MSTADEEPQTTEPEHDPNTVNEESSISAPASGPDSDAQYIRLRRSHIYLALIPVAALLGFAGGYFVWEQDRGAAPDSAPASAPQAQAEPVQASRFEVDPGGDPSIGPVDAPVTIVEFSDFTCPYCQRWHLEVFQKVLDR